MTFSLSRSIGTGAAETLTSIKADPNYAELFEAFETDGALLTARIDDLDASDDLFDRIDVALLDMIVQLPDPVDPTAINNLGELKRLMIEVQRDVDRHRIYIARERDQQSNAVSTDVETVVANIESDISQETSTGDALISFSSQHGADDLQVKETEHEQADQEEQPVERKRGRRSAGADG